jgi:diamine N-acetyltransferase
MIDLFDFNPQHQRAGIGIVIDSQFQGNSYAFDALNVLTYYSFKHLHLHQLYANITPDNTKSIGLFEKCGFQLVGEKKDWLRAEGSYKSELLYQLIDE